MWLTSDSVFSSASGVISSSIRVCDNSGWGVAFAYLEVTSFSQWHNIQCQWVLLTTVKQLM